jgi:hypothetical protein
MLTRPSESLHAGMLQALVPQMNTITSASGAPFSSTIVARTEVTLIGVVVSP